MHPLSIAMFVFAAGFYAWAAFTAYQQLRFTAASKRLVSAPGIVRPGAWVQDVQVSNSPRRVDMKALKVDFTVDGRPHVCTRWELYGGSVRIPYLPHPPVAPAGGADMTVWYDPKNPRISTLYMNRPIYSAVVVAATMGLGLTVFGVLNLFQR